MPEDHLQQLIREKAYPESARKAIASFEILQRFYLLLCTLPQERQEIVGGDERPQASLGASGLRVLRMVLPRLYLSRRVPNRK